MLREPVSNASYNLCHLCRTTASCVHYLASEITAKFWERKDELVEALTAIFALFLFKTFILPLILFLFLYGSLRGVFVRSTI